LVGLDQAMPAQVSVLECFEEDEAFDTQMIEFCRKQLIPSVFHNPAHQHLLDRLVHVLDMTSQLYLNPCETALVSAFMSPVKPSLASDPSRARVTAATEQVLDTFEDVIPVIKENLAISALRCMFACCFSKETRQPSPATDSGSTVS